MEKFPEKKLSLKELGGLGVKFMIYNCFKGLLFLSEGIQVCAIFFGGGVISPSPLTLAAFIYILISLKIIGLIFFLYLSF